MDQSLDLESAIREHLVCYLAGKESLGELTHWFVGATWDIEHDPSGEARDLAYSVDPALIEASSGLLTLDELRAKLRDLSHHAVHPLP